MNRLQNQVYDIYSDYVKKIQMDFQNSADAKAVAAQLTIAYCSVAAFKEEEDNKQLNLDMTKGESNGYKFFTRK